MLGSQGTRNSSVIRLICLKPMGDGSTGVYPASRGAPGLVPPKQGAELWRLCCSPRTLCTVSSGAHLLSWCFNSQSLMDWPDFPMATRVAGMRPSLRGGALSFVGSPGHSSVPSPLPATKHQPSPALCLPPAPNVSSWRDAACPHTGQGWQCPSALWEAPSSSGLCAGQQARWEEGRPGGSGLYPQLDTGPCHIQRLLCAPQQQHQGSALLPLGRSLWAVGEGCRGSC